MQNRDDIADLRLCLVDEIGQCGKEVATTLDDRRVHLMLFARDGEVTAWLNICPHKKRSLNLAPDKFVFNGCGQLVCSHHGATFAFPRGECVEGPCLGARLTAVPTEIVDGWVVLKK